MHIGTVRGAAGAAALAALLSAPALAADYPVLRGSQIEDAPTPSLYAGSYNWTGFYVGGGAGVSDTKFKPDTGLQDLARFAFRNTALGQQVDMGGLVNNLPEKSDSGATYFGFLGYNVAFGDAVIGIEADYTRSGHSYRIDDYIARRFVTANGDVNDISLTTQQAAKLDDYATARLRLGWAFGSIMPFATLGGAVGRFNTSSTIDARWNLTQTNPLTGTVSQGQAAGYPLTVGASKKNVYGFGLTVGGGVDWALAENIFLRGEYQLIRFADVEGTTTTVNTARAAVGVKF
ncbi:outer membrane protein [Bosea minatitlanensis]|uniref:Outer membrane protein n=1 Tax=Bosea minatitlanensis TaxID=128782 RepID=A0ABW0F234_9HYPH|nr:outer membrane beta-barrel protein [Bosea minatitlanensis]MCT4492671.1 outer membrane beta-barrel protein [Bosea minatitlanensis]